MADNVQKDSLDSVTFDFSQLAAIGAAYQRKLLEINQANARAAFEYATSLASCRSPADFMKVTQEYTARQIETVQEQARELMNLAKSQ